MNLVASDIKKTYFKYFAAAFGSTLIGSIYAVVDMAMVGQYQGPSGTAALAVVAPIWNIIYSLGFLTGIGGSILFAQAKGQNNTDEMNQNFSATLLYTTIIALVCWLTIIFFDTPLLKFFGAKEQLLPLTKLYLAPIKWVIPTFMFSQMLSAFLRNDNAPGLATASVLGGGIFNIFGDYFFVFYLDMGIKGAGIATAMGGVITVVVLLSHFFSQNNTLKLSKIVHFFNRTVKISKLGFGTFIVDIAMGVLTILFNRQIVKYLESDALAVYGVIINISTTVQCCGYSVGQAGQPIISTAFGSGKWERVQLTLRYMIITSFIFGLVWMLSIWVFPNAFISVFMKATPQLLAISPSILRIYGASFLLIPFNVFSTYYFQSIMKPGLSLVIASARGIIISGALILLLPLHFAPSSIWFAMPLTELIVAFYVVTSLIKVNRQNKITFS